MRSLASPPVRIAQFAQGQPAAIRARRSAAGSWVRSIKAWRRNPSCSRIPPRLAAMRRARSAPSWRPSGR